MCNVDPSTANFSIPGGPIFIKFILLESPQREESEFHKNRTTKCRKIGCSRIDITHMQNIKFIFIHLMSFL